MLNKKQQKEILGKVFVLAKKEYLKNAEIQDNNKNLKVEENLEQKLNEI